MLFHSPVIFLLILLPLAGALICALFGRRFSVQVTGAIASAAVLLSFGLSVHLFQWLNRIPLNYPYLWESLFSWITTPGFSVGFDLMIDPISSTMAMVITGVGFLIHVYSIGYMGHDPGYPRYFALLNLFVAAMLTLVLGKNLLVTFLGWEGVGLCSYALIGFWYTDESKASAGKKAFVVNRIGDFGFLIGLLTLFYFFRSIDYVELKELFASAPEGAFPQIQNFESVCTAIMLALFVGAVGKSAQFPLHVWLPDAMAGPTPVSALIHAATMVTAGVFLVSRMSFLQPYAPTAFSVIAITGVFTAFIAASIALVQRDIKRILAYSTISQLGFMFLACGVGAPVAGLFHMVTHAFFKALLFLGAGSVIHAMHEEQDIFRMGGLFRAIPVTAVSMLVGVLAISGVPPLSGFVSKDEILFLTLQSGHVWLYAVALLTAFLTAFYMGRLYMFTFLGSKSSHAAHLSSIHESPAVMLFALIVLGALSVGAGWLGWPHGLGGHNMFHHFLASSVTETTAHGDEHGALSAVSLAVISTLVGVSGLILAFVWANILSGSTRVSFQHRVSTVYAVLFHGYALDLIYSALVVRPLRGLSQFLWKSGDSRAIDGLVNSIADSVQGTGQEVSRLQNGIAQFYGFVMVLAAAVIIVFVLGRG